MPSPPKLIRSIIARAGYHSWHTLETASPLLSTKTLASRSGNPHTRLRLHLAKPNCATFSTGASGESHAPMRRALTVHVRGLAPDVDNEKLHAALSVCGEIAEARIRASHKSADAWATGYVRFTSQKSVDGALALHRKIMLGKGMLQIHAQYELPDTISVGRLPLNVEDARLKALFSPCGEVIDVKIHPTLTGKAAGRCYAVVRFASPASVQTALRKRFRLDGRSLHVARAMQAAEERSIWDDYAEDEPRRARMIWVENLPPQINEKQLEAEFGEFGDVLEAHVSRTLRTGGSLGYGFVVFSSPTSVENALQLNGTKKIAGHPTGIARAPALRPASMENLGIQGPADSERDEHKPITTIFVGRLTSDVDEALLWREFQRFGDIVNVHIGRERDTGKSRGFAYINFASSASVDQAIEYNGRLTIDGYKVKIVRDSGIRRSGRNIVDSARGDRDSYNNHLNADSWEYDY